MSGTASVAFCPMPPWRRSPRTRAASSRSSGSGDGRVATLARPSGHDSAVKRRAEPGVVDRHARDLVVGDHLELAACRCGSRRRRPGHAERRDEALGDRRKGAAQVDARDDRVPVSSTGAAPVLGIEPVDGAGALHRARRPRRRARGEGLVGARESPRVPPLDRAQKADHLVARRRSARTSRPADRGDHLGRSSAPSSSRRLRRRHAPPLGGSGARPDVAETVGGSMGRPPRRRPGIGRPP